MTTTIAIIGAGGFGLEILSTVRACAAQFPAARNVYVDKMAAPVGRCGVPILSTEDFLAVEGDKRFVVAIASAAIRRRVSDQMARGGVSPLPVVAASSVIAPDSVIGEGLVVSGFCTIEPEVRIGRFFQCNMYSYVAHECSIGDFVTFSPRVSCNGNVIIEDDVFVGSGAIIRNGAPDAPLVIGKGATVGMGAVVTRSVAADTMVLGNPARPRL